LHFAVNLLNTEPVKNALLKTATETITRAGLTEAGKLVKTRFDNFKKSLKALCGRDSEVIKQLDTLQTATNPQRQDAALKSIQQAVEQLDMNDSSLAEDLQGLLEELKDLRTSTEKLQQAVTTYHQSQVAGDHATQVQARDVTGDVAGTIDKSITTNNITNNNNNNYIVDSVKKKGIPLNSVNLQDACHCFTGRREQLETLKTLLLIDQNSRKVAIAAVMGGSGKTQLAVHYAIENEASYSRILFFGADTQEVFQKDIGIHHTALKLPGESFEDKGLNLRLWLMKEHDQPVLMILDNVDTQASVDFVNEFVDNKYYPKVHFLYTSRRTDKGAAWPVMVEVGLFTPDEACEFLKARTKQEPDDFATQLTKELGGLPLALEQAAALIVTREWTYKRYLNKFKDKAESLKLLTQGAGITKSVAVTWLMNLEEMRKNPNHPCAADFLNLCGMMAPETIPYEWISQGLAITEPETYGQYTDIEDAKDLITDLNTYALIQQQGNEGFSLHRLVQAVIQNQPAFKAQAESLHLRCMKAVSVTFPEDNQWHTWHPTFSNQGFYLTQQAFNPNTEDRVLLSNRLGCFYYSQGEYTKAEPLYLKVLEIRKSILGELHPDTATSYNNLGLLYDSQGYYMKAEPLYLKAIKIYESTLGDYHPDIATSYHNLGYLYKTQREYTKAEPLYLKAMEIRKSILGDYHPDTATSYNNLGLLYDSQGEYTKAKPLYLKAMEIRKSILGDYHPDTASSYHNLGSLYYNSQGEYTKAEPLYLKAIEIRESILGEHHPSTASSYNNLGLLYTSQGDYPEAESLYLKAIEIRESILGDYHPDTATSYNNLAELYRTLGDYTKADYFYRKAYLVLVSTVGDNHPSTQRVYEDWVGSELNKGKQK
jgi:tetratricopeptide (TPR) repeat protein